MRPHIVTSAVFSLSRLSTTSATITTTTTFNRTTTALKTLAATCPQRLFTSSASQCQPVKPQFKTIAAASSSSFTATTSKHILTPSAPYSTNMASSLNATTILELSKIRRTHYVLNKELSVSKERIQEIVKEAILQVPSSFNSQSNRIVVLFGAEHDKFWDFTSEVLKTIVPADAWQHTADRMAMFKAAAGTVCSCPRNSLCDLDC